MPGSSSREEGKCPPSLHDLVTLDKVTLDTSIIVGRRSLEFVSAARLRYYRGYWSNWIVAEFSRVRTAMIIRRARRELGITEESEGDASIQGEIERRLLRSKAKVNAAVDDFSRVLTNVSYHDAERTDLSWLTDRDDIRVMQTAIAAGVPGVLVTDNSHDFPIGEVRNGILIVSGDMFLEHIYHLYPEAREVITRLAEARRQNLRSGNSIDTEDSEEP
ncbi:MAG: hypothetical protein EPO21_20875 [Chloroflexota bacterium]|nr:MAG: hypothetical protein EPO21_20875 [Chloroflexota bacterium]